MPETSHGQRKRQLDSNTPLRPKRLRSALEKATGCRVEQRPTSSEDELRVEVTSPSGEGVRPMEEWGDFFGQRIEDAMRQGVFDNLSGHGKPLNLDRDPFLPEDQQIPATLLRNNDLSPAWISERKILLNARDRLRAELRVATLQMKNDWSSPRGDAFRSELRTRWTKWLSAWRVRIDNMNDQSLVHNLKQTVSYLEIVILHVATEPARAGVNLSWADERD